jgi:hypothetical protein
MPGWKCFLTEPSEFVRVDLRRYSGGSKCVTKTGIHDVAVVIDPQKLAAIEGPAGTIPEEEEQKDPRWPKACACGYKFHVEDSWQRNVDTLYKGSPDGNLYVLRELPVGAMWNASWFVDDEGGRARYAGPDGKGWCVMMPSRQEWIVYGPSSDNTKWQVTGVPPMITVHPSIAINNKLKTDEGYHGFIKGGVISEDCEGRKFEGVPRTA